ncbi:Bloom syndrome protein (BLM) [Vairimorpha necatrix]|uniref:ATP-dependent DNA helicase n=1 Tax=Vairimorpha necatrix TaxID=6039 RepID=A0AAX4JEQ0_9MICR
MKSNKYTRDLENDDSFINTVYQSKESSNNSDIEFLECIKSLDSDNIIERADKFIENYSEDEIEIINKDINYNEYIEYENFESDINEYEMNSYDINQIDNNSSSPQLYYLRHIFKLEKFRPNQEEIISSILKNKNVFVLMPTGGGKSLCYQIPSLISPGISIIISPLLSLVHDQISNLLKKNILALPFNSTLNNNEKKMVLENMSKGIIKIYYLTPESLCTNFILEKKLKELEKKNLLSRFIIDEAHCVSQWGHDFRPDYIEIKKIRNIYPSVPVVALTATATPKVELDILTNLQITNAEIFKQSFNRENLKYFVKLKTKTVEIDIVTFIISHYKNECGIIYCTSKKECEMISEKLNKHLKTAFYHAGLTKKERISVQSMWNENKFKIIVATIAFGMGIDKKDVRFVIHYSIPKSLEGYYQETGRAGRDGKESVCILYYTYSDKKKLDYMINMNKDLKQKQRQRDELRDVIRFCENKTDCRRSLILSYFSEKFDSKKCQKGCDNCMIKNKMEVKDYTKEAREIWELVKYKLSIHQIIDIYRGIGSKKVDSEYQGKGKHLKRIEVERIVTQMVVKGHLEEKSEVNGMGYSWSYLVHKQNVKKFELHEEIKEESTTKSKNTQSGNIVKKSKVEKNTNVVKKSKIDKNVTKSKVEKSKVEKSKVEKNVTQSKMTEKILKSDDDDIQIINKRKN